MNDKSILAVLIIIAFLLWQKSSSKSENEEAWEVQRDDRGRLVNITVHRKVEAK